MRLLDHSSESSERYSMQEQSPYDASADVSQALCCN